VGSHVTRRLGITAGTLLLVTGSQATLAAPSDTGHGSRDVAYTTTAESVGGDFGCDPTDPVRCAGTYRIVRTFTGDLTGTAYVVGSAVLLGDATYQGQSVIQFTGEVEGCGQGTLVMLEEGVLDPASGGSRGTWTIVAGRGTGDLAGTTGSGTADTSVSAETVGRVRCA
jgi:Protein of unknown function (DUF3224)